MVIDSLSGLFVPALSAFLGVWVLLAIFRRFVK